MRLLILPGDGIGPEITEATMTVLDVVDRRYQLGFACEHEDIGFASLEKHGTTLRPQLLEQAKSCDGVLLGPQSHMDYPPESEGGVNISAAFRGKLDLFANVRPARTRPGVPHRGTEMDLVIMREATEGFYPDRNMVVGKGEFMPTDEIALSVRKITRHGCRRIAIEAFKLARQRRGKVTAVHKANNFPVTDGLFLEEVHKVANDFPDVELEERIIDAMAALLVRDASQFDVICATNFHGDILSDLASELSGGLGLAGAINANESMCAAQAQHGSAPDIQGQNIANPTSLMLSAAMLLRWYADRTDEPRFREAGDAIERAVEETLADPVSHTRDLGGSATTQSFAAAVCRALC